MLKNTTHSFGSVTKILHWAIALLILLMFLSGYFDLPPHIHKLLGLSVLLLMILRILWRVSNPMPKLPPRVTNLERALARAVQGLLYFTLLAMPLSGWMMSTAFGHPPRIGTLNLPFPGLTHLSNWGPLLWDLHSSLAIVILVLIGLHFLGAMKHFFIDHDGVMQRMLPRCFHRRLKITQWQKKLKRPIKLHPRVREDDTRRQ